jgi:hypothetical protein
VIKENTIAFGRPDFTGVLQLLIVSDAACVASFAGPGAKFCIPADMAIFTHQKMSLEGLPVSPAKSSSKRCA